MARCELTGKGPAVKNLVSHSNIKTKSRNMPNVQSKRLFSQVLNRFVTLKLATTTLKALEAVGGIDNYIVNQKDEVLSKRAFTAKKSIQRVVRGKAKQSGDRSEAKN